MINKVIVGTVQNYIQSYKKYNDKMNFQQNLKFNHC